MFYNRKLTNDDDKTINYYMVPMKVMYVRTKVSNAQINQTHTHIALGTTAAVQTTPLNLSLWPKDANCFILFTDAGKTFRLTLAVRRICTTLCITIIIAVLRSNRQQTDRTRAITKSKRLSYKLTRKLLYLSRT